MKFSQACEFLTGCVQHNIECAEHGKSPNDYVVPFFVGDPGTGKTAIPKTVAQRLGLPYMQTIVAQYDAGELAGLPFLGEKTIDIADDDGHIIRTETHQRMVRLRPSYLPDIHDPEQLIGIYNLDELPQAFQANQNVCSQLVNEWGIGEHKVSRGITMCATGNRPENKAGTTTMPTHLKDRLTFIFVEVDSEEFLSYAVSVGIDHRIRSFLKNNPRKLHMFDVGANASPNPRSWEKSSSILNMNLSKAVRTEALFGQIGEGVGTEFEAYLRVEDKMPKLDFVINNPEQAPVFSEHDADVLYMLLTALADSTTHKNVANIIKYIKRLPNQEWATVWSKDAFTRDKSLLENKDVTKWKMTDGANLLL